MKSSDEVQKEINENPNFFSETFVDLKNNNPYLAGFAAKTAIEAAPEKAIQARILQVSLTALKMMGATKKSDPDFVRVYPQTIVKMETEGFPESLEEKFPIDIMTEIFSMNISHEMDTKINFSVLWPKVEMVIKAVIIEKYGKEIEETQQTAYRKALKETLDAADPKAKKAFKKYIPLPPDMRDES